MGIFDTFRKRPDNISSKVKLRTPGGLQQAVSGMWQVGQRIGDRYEIYHIRGGPGKSGMGIVYLCFDHEFGEPVAIKTFQDKFLQDRTAIERFKWEAETWVRLDKHFNIVQAKFFKKIDEKPYIFLEYVVGDAYFGTDLSGWIWRGGLSLPLTLNFAIQFCHGMIYAESKFNEMGKPFVHRDIKPSNILITQDKVVKITDFGLVKAFADSGEDILALAFSDEFHHRLSFSKSGNICGTPPYMSPEQCRGEKDIDTRSDIYSFGCVLYEMVTQKYVFNVRTPDEFMTHHLNKKPKSPNVQKELDKVIMKCLEKDPSKRYQDFNELSDVLSEIYHSFTGEFVKLPEATALKMWELNNKGLSFSNLDLLEDAIGCYKQAIRIDPNYSHAHVNLGHTYRDQGKLDVAIGEYREALRIDPNDTKAHFALGLTYHAQDKLKDAIEECEEAVELEDNIWFIHLFLGKAYRDQGKLDAALRELQDAIKLDPNVAEPHYVLGCMYRDRGDLDDAVGEFRKAVRLEPEVADSHFDLGVTYHIQGRLEEAVSELREAVRLNPNDTSTHTILGLTYRSQGKLEDAIKEWKETLRLDPTSVEARRAYEMVYEHLSGLNNSVEELQEAVRLNPNNARAHYDLGCIYREQGNLDKAVEEFKETIKIDPNFDIAHHALGSIYEDQGRISEFIVEIKEIIRINPDDAIMHSTLGITYQEQGNLEEAIKEWKEALRIEPSDALVHYSMGFAYQAQGNLKEAVSCYKEFIRLASPEHASLVKQTENSIRIFEKKI